MSRRPPTTHDLRPTSPGLAAIYDWYVGVDPARVSEYSRAREDARRDDVILRAIGELVERWEAGDAGDVPLHEWLGMSWEDWAAMTADPLDIPAGYIVPERPIGGL